MKKKVVEEKEKLSLPTEMSEKVDTLGGYTQLLYGEKKIGKTTLAACYPDNMMLMFEPGGKSLEIYQRPVRSWVEFRKYLKLLARDKGRFKTVTCDTADLMFKQCFEHTCREMGIEHPGDENDFGKSWGRIRDEFASAMQELLSLDKGVILTSHAVEAEVKTKMGRSFHRIQPTMSGQARAVLEPMVDIWTYYGYEGDKRRLWLRGDELIAAGHRLTDHFRYTDGTNIRYLDVESADGSSAPTYEKFVRAFNNELARKLKKKKGKSSGDKEG